MVWPKYCFVAQHDGELAMFFVRGMCGDTIVGDNDDDDASTSSTTSESDTSLNDGRGVVIVDVH